MASGTTMWLIGLAVSVWLFVFGYVLSRMKKSPVKSVIWFGKSVDDPVEVLAKVNLIGKIQMIFAPLFLILWTLMLFGVLGPVEGIQTIKLN